MTPTERKALGQLNEVRAERRYCDAQTYPADRKFPPFEALCRAIEQHEAYRQEVSDAVEWVVNSTYMPAPSEHKLRRFIIAKPDPLVEALNDMKDGRAGPTTESYAACLRAAIEKRGGKIVWGEG